MEDTREVVPGRSPGEPARVRPAVELGERMSRHPRRDTAPALALRRELHRRGLRFRLEVPVPGAARRRIDIAFTRPRVAVFVDGCFWHGCPEHGAKPTTNAEWWRWKVERNKTRDRDTDRLLAGSGWRVVRVWEHEDVACAAALVDDVIAAVEWLGR